MGVYAKVALGSGFFFWAFRWVLSGQGNRASLLNLNPKTPSTNQEAHRPKVNELNRMTPLEFVRIITVLTAEAGQENLHLGHTTPNPKP